MIALLLIAAAEPQVDVIAAVDGLGFSATVRGTVKASLGQVQAVVADPLVYPSWIPAMKAIKREGGSAIYAVVWDLPWPVGETRQRLLFEHHREGADDVYTWSQVSGAMHRHDGMFRVRAEGDQTHVEYVSAIALKTWIPEWLLRTIQRRSLPSFVRRLEERALHGTAR